jgi:hypothetical protein
MRCLFSQSDWLRFANPSEPQIKPPAPEELASFGQVGQTPGLQPDPPVGFGRASGPPVVPSLSRTPAQVKEQRPVTENWLRLVKTHPWGRLLAHQSSQVWPRRLAVYPAPVSKKLASFRQLPQETLQTKSRIDSYTELASFGGIGARQSAGRPTGASAADQGVRPPKTYACTTASGAVLFSPCSHSWKRSR